MLFLIFLLFVIGIAFGSFFLVLIDRLPKGISPLRGRSQCESCNHTLNGFDLIPLVSFLMLRGRCRYCSVKLSYYYPSVELVTGLLFALTPYFLSFTTHVPFLSTEYLINVLYTLFVLATFIITFFMDIRYRLIPFAVIIPGIVITLVYHILMEPSAIVSLIISGVGAGLFFYAIYFFTKGRGMGFGDVILAVYLGVLLGFPSIVSALYIAFLTGAGVSLILIMIGRKKMKGGTIPFGPFLIFGAFLSFFWGEQLLNAFFRMFMK